MTNKLPIYLDYAATTPVDPRVIQKMASCLSFEGIFANAASTHSFGIQAKEVIDKAREEVATLIHGVARNVIFTSGATEANNLAIKGVAHFYQNRGKHIVTSKTEHKAVLDVCAHLEEIGFLVTYLETNEKGIIDVDEFRSALREDTILVSLMQVNNETGVKQDIEQISKITRELGIFFHVDAAQSVGKIPVNLQRLSVDLLSFSAHKFYGPKGIGALYVNDNPRVRLLPLVHGGGQERKLRAGTLPTHQIVGFGEACRIAGEVMEQEASDLKYLRDRFWEGIQDLPGITLNGDEHLSIANILNVRFPRVEREILRMRLKDLAISYASACHSISLEPSHVLQAMGLTREEASRSIRFSFGRFTTVRDIDRAIDLIRTQYLKSED